jgi:phenylalanyl-tRNA synthetase alpha subunit
MKWKIPLYIVGIGTLAAGAFGVGVYSSGEVNKTYQKVQESVSCLYSAENCQKQDNTEAELNTAEPKLVSAPTTDDKYAAEISSLREEVKALQQKSLNPQTNLYSQKDVIHVTIPIDALLSRLGKEYAPGTNSYRSFTDKIKEFCVEKTFEEGKKELERKFQHTHESIDQVIDSTTSFLGDKVTDYRRRLGDAIYPEGSASSELSKPELNQPEGGN